VPWAGLPILALTANPSDEVRAHGLTAGTSDLIANPVAPSATFATLGR